jgi:hypothetical protein
MKVGPHVVKEQSDDLLKDAARELLQRVEAGKISENMAVLVICKNPDIEGETA